MKEIHSKLFSLKEKTHLCSVKLFEYWITRVFFFFLSTHTLWAIDFIPSSSFKLQNTLPLSSSLDLLKVSNWKLQIPASVMNNSYERIHPSHIRVLGKFAEHTSSDGREVREEPPAREWQLLFVTCPLLGLFPCLAVESSSDCWLNRPAVWILQRNNFWKKVIAKLHTSLSKFTIPSTQKTENFGIA